MVDCLLASATQALHLLCHSAVTHDYAYIRSSTWRLAHSMLDLTQGLSDSSTPKATQVWSIRVFIITRPLLQNLLIGALVVERHTKHFITRLYYCNPPCFAFFTFAICYLCQIPEFDISRLAGSTLTLQINLWDRRVVVAAGSVPERSSWDEGEIMVSSSWCGGWCFKTRTQDCSWSPLCVVRRVGVYSPDKLFILLINVLPHPGCFTSLNHSSGLVIITLVFC